MPAINIDFTGSSAGGGDFEVIEPGIYPAVLTKIELKPAGPSGYKYLRVTYEVGEKKTWCSQNWSLSPKALWRMKTDLVRLGVEVPDGEMDFDPSELIGTECYVKVVNTEDGGTTYNNVEEIVSPEAATSGINGDADDDVSWS